MRRFLIITTSGPTLKWPSLRDKLSEIVDALREWEVSIEHDPVIPHVVDGKIDHHWLQNLITPYFDEGYDVVGLHMSDAQRKKWKIKPALRGANPITGNEYGDFYFWADEHTKREGLNQFVQTCLHEFGHEYFQKTGKHDVIHLVHDLTPDIIPFIKTFDWSLYQPDRATLRATIQGLYAKIKGLMAKPTTLQHPVPAYRNYITQVYGVPSKRYPRTGRHIGTDYGTPVGTPILAPWDGKITTAGTGPHTGNFCHFEYTYNGQKWEERWCHLKSVPEMGSYKRGEWAATTGNTGQSTGAHLHRELWKNDVRIDLITKNNWASLTADPEKHI